MKNFRMRDEYARRGHEVIDLEEDLKWNGKNNGYPLRFENHFRGSRMVPSSEDEWKNGLYDNE